MDECHRWQSAVSLARHIGITDRHLRQAARKKDSEYERQPAPPGSDHKWHYRLRLAQEDDTPAPSYRDLADELTGDQGGDEVLDHFVERWKLRSKHRRQRTTRCEWNLGRKPVALVCLADQHIGSPGTRADLIVRDARLLSRTEGAYCANIGDSINNMVVGRLQRVGAVHDDSVDDQWLFLRAYMLLLQPKVLWWVAGNHELWSAGMGHLDPTGVLARELNVSYDKYEMGALLTVGHVEYRVTSRHQYKGHSMYNDVHANNRLYLEGDHAAFGDRHPDVVLLGHKHSYAYSKQQRNGRLRTYITVGSYKTADSYGRAKGFQDALPYMGVLVLRPDRRQVEVHDDLAFVCREYLPWLRSRS